MESFEHIPQSETISEFPYDAIVVLPYSQRERPPKNGKRRYRMSHYTARAALAGWELYHQGAAPFIILPGEQINPATSDMEAEFLQKKGVPETHIINFPNLNGTQEQLDPIAELQDSGKIGKVLIVSFAFHKPRVASLVQQWGITGDIAEVEETHALYLQSLNPQHNAVHIREVLVNMPRVKKLEKVEHGLPTLLTHLDRRSGRKAPFARKAKFLMGPAVSDIDKTGLARVEHVKMTLLLYQDLLRSKVLPHQQSIA